MRLAILHWPPNSPCTNGNIWSQRIRYVLMCQPLPREHLPNRVLSNNILKSGHYERRHLKDKIILYLKWSFYSYGISGTLRVVRKKYFGVAIFTNILFTPLRQKPYLLIFMWWFGQRPQLYFIFHKRELPFIITNRSKQT